MKLLVMADAVTQTGFARVTHNLCRYLHADHKWDVHVVGVNYTGDPHAYPYKIYPAILGGDAYGMGRMEHLCREIKPDVMLIINDPWIVQEYLHHANQQTGKPSIPEEIPVIAYMPVDSPNQEAGKNLLRLARAIAYTAFGRKELTLGGFTGRCDVIPHGVDTDMYHPEPMNEVRKRLKFKGSPDLSQLFIVGNVNRNMYRKKLDLTIQYWTQWWITAGQPNHAYLYLHCSNKDEGWNVIKLARYYGIETQLIITNPNMTVQNCMHEAEMRTMYSMFSVQMTTTLGEGWGLTTHEGMACGVPQILPRYSALGEWPRDAVHHVEVTAYDATHNRINTIGGRADMEQTVAAIQKFYSDKEYRAQMGALALARATETRFQWPKIAEQFHRVLLETVQERQHRGPIGIVRPTGTEAPQA